MKDAAPAPFTIRGERGPVSSGGNHPALGPGGQHKCTIYI